MLLHSIAIFRDSFDDLQYFLNCTKTNFDIIGVTETRVTKELSLLISFNLNNYSHEFTPTETPAGGNLPYIANHLSYKCQNGLISIKRIN